MESTSDETIRCASKLFILTQRTQNLEFVNLTGVTYTQPFHLSFNCLVYVNMLGFSNKFSRLANVTRYSKRYLSTLVTCHWFDINIPSRHSSSSQVVMKCYRIVNWVRYTLVFSSSKQTKVQHISPHITTSSNTQVCFQPFITVSTYADKTLLNSIGLYMMWHFIPAL